MRTRFFTLSALAVAAIALLGCNKVEEENIVPQKNGIPFEFTASGVDTKTATDGVHTTWVSGDKVNLFHAVAGSTTYVSDGAFTADADGASVKFTGTLAGELTAANYDWYAIYPYIKNIVTPASTTAGFLTVGSSATGSQSQTGNSSMAHLAGKNYPVAGKVLGVAKDGKPSIAMSHLTSIVAVKVTNGTSTPITVSSVSFTGTEDIVGTYYINFVNSPVVYTASGATYVSNTANLNVTSGAAIAAGDNATFYMAVKPFTAPSAGTLTLSVTATNGAQSRNKTLTADATFAAGTINTLNFTYDKAPSDIPEPTSETGWYRVEKPEWLAVGDRVIIANHDGTKAMSKAYKASNRDGVDVTTATSGKYTILTNNDNVQMFILEDGTKSGSFAFWADNGDDASKYMYAASSSSNNLKFQANIDANASFVATLVDGLGNLTAQGTNTHKVVQWNNLFNCYTAASYNSISIYKYYGVWTGSTTCTDPVISQEGNTVTITSTTPGATIYYTTDGADPDPSVVEQKYSHAFAIASAVTVKAIAVKSHYTNSGIVSRECAPKVATPLINSLGTSFEISCATEGATIYYETSTTDMASVATPTTSSTPYTAAVAITQTTYVKAIAVKTGCTNSEVASETCTYSGGGGGGGKTNQVLFHETFGNNTGSARAWNDSYSVKSGVSAVYSGITGYTVSNAKQGKNTTGSTQSGLNQTTANTDAYIIIGPLDVSSAENMVLTYQWKAASTKATYSTSLFYATSSSGSYNEVAGTGAGATTFVERTYNLPAAAQVSTLYLKIVWNTSNTQAIIDEVNLQGDY